MGVVTRKGLMALVRANYGPRGAGIALTALVIANLGTLCAEFAGVAAVGELFHVSRYVMVPVAGLGVSLLVLRGYTFYGVVLVIAAAIVLIPGAPLVKILYLTQALNAVLLLAILPFMRRLALDPAVMGVHILTARGRWITAAALAMIAASVGALLVLTVF